MASLISRLIPSFLVNSKASFLFQVFTEVTGLCLQVAQCEHGCVFRNPIHYSLLAFIVKLLMAKTNTLCRCVLSTALRIRVGISKVDPAYFLILHYKQKICKSYERKPGILAFYVYQGPCL